MKTSRFSFPRRVRILGGECDAVARALHHTAQKVAFVRNEQTLISDEKAFLSQADSRKALESTFIERKQMSTKTTLKRIALVAVSALGFGLLSVAPSQAAVNWIVVGKATEDDGAVLAASKYTASKVLSPNGISAFSVVAGSAVELQIIADDELDADTYKVSMTGFGVILSDTLAGGAEDELLAPFTATSVVGTYPLVVTVDEDGDFSTVGDQYSANVTMTVTAPAAWSKSLSKSFIGSGNADDVAATATTDALTASGSATAADENRGFITLSFNDTNNAALATGVAISAQITAGPGYLIMTDDNTTVEDTCEAEPTYSATVGRAISAFAADAVNTLYICADGTAGKATITISVTNQLVTTAAWSTKEFTFYGAVRTLSAAANYTIGVAGGDTTGAAEDGIADADYVKNPIDDTTDVPAIIISAKDSAGQLATAAAVPVVISSDITVVASGTCVLDDGSGTYSSGEGFGVYNCSFTTAATAVSGQSATLTFRIADPLGVAGIDYLTTTQKVTVGDARYTETLSLNKTTYSAGEAMVVTRSAKDKSGNPVYDGATAPQVIFNKVIGGSGTTVAAGWYTNGTVATSASKPSVFAPSVSGAFEARMTGYNGSSTSTSAIILTATVGESATDEAIAAAADAAAEAIDAANAATDAANLAAEAADAATVAAEEARDAADAATAAVEALATEVATLMAALKAQITTLANTVAKIAKKVKA